MIIGILFIYKIIDSDVLHKMFLEWSNWFSQGFQKFLFPKIETAFITINYELITIQQKKQTRLVSAEVMQCFNTYILYLMYIYVYLQCKM